MANWNQVFTSQLVGALRLDAEFWQPKYTQKETNIRRGKHTRLGNLLTTFKKGIFYILAREYTSEGVPFYRSSNVGSILPKEDNLAFITSKKHSTEHKTALTRGDLMIVKTGKSGASVVFKETCNVSQDVIATKVRRAAINPFYLAVYLNTSYGSSEMNRWFQGQVQPHLSLEDARRIWIATISDDEQKTIEALVLRAETARRQALDSWENANQLLESVLFLDKLVFQKPVGYIARFGDLELSRRSDAQHFQPQFSTLIEHLGTFSTAKMRTLRKLNRRGVQPVYIDNGEIAVVNSQHLGLKHIAYDGLERTSKAHFLGSPEAHICQNDLLIYSTGAYVGRTNVYLDEAPALASNHVNIIRLAPEIDAAYMGLVMQSVVGQFQTQQHIRGSAQAELYPSDIDKFVMPLIAHDIQKRIGDLVRDSLIKQRESARLLEEAKTRVEQLIEEAVQP